MRARPWTRVALAVLCAVLASGCVLQPVDETALTGLDPQLGATPAPVDDADADRAAHEAQLLADRYMPAKGRGDGVWTAPRTEEPALRSGPVGLIRDDSTEDTQDPDRPRTRRQRGDDPAIVQRPRDDGGTTNTGGNNGGTSDGGTSDGGAGDGGSGQDPGDDEKEPAPAPPAPKPSPRPRPPSTPTFRALGGASDAGDDASGTSPRYADITELLIESDGERARVTVAVAASIPDALQDGEVQGIGVDFYRSDDVESDYQLFIDGDDEGWRAFLQSPDGVVQYPGSFGVGGRVFVLELPWESLGGRRPARVNMFIDWSKRDTPINRVGNDRAPDEGKFRIDPR